MRVLRIIRPDLAALGSLEHRNVLSDGPRVSKGDLLNVQLAGKAIQAVDDDAIGDAALEGDDRSR